MSSSASSSHCSAPAKWVDEYADSLYRYALSRVRRPEVAEDLVQETLLAAWRSRHSFRRESAEMTWLFGILRHKILDHFRSRSRGMAEAADDEGERWVEQCYNQRGRMRQPPGPWRAEPETLLEAQEFWEVLNRCLDHLPPRSREVFARREMEQEESLAICKDLDIEPTNLWVILHRARAMLRKCLEIHWFAGSKPFRKER